MQTLSHHQSWPVGSSPAVHRAFDPRSWSSLVPRWNTQNCPAADVWWDALYMGLIVNQD